MDGAEGDDVAEMMRTGTTYHGRLADEARGISAATPEFEELERQRLAMGPSLEQL